MFHLSNNKFIGKYWTTHNSSAEILDEMPALGEFGGWDDLPYLWIRLGSEGWLK